MNIKVEKHDLQAFVKKYGKLITEALLLDFLQPLGTQHKDVTKDVIQGTSGNEIINHLLKAIQTNKYNLAVPIYGIYRNTYLSILAPISGSNISCSCILVGKFPGSISKAKFPLTNGFNFNTNNAAQIGSRDKLKAKYFLLGLILNCFYHSLYGNGTGHCNTEIVLIKDNETYNFYFKYLEKLNLNLISMEYFNTNTGRELTKVIFNLHDMCNKMLASDFDIDSLSDLLFFNSGYNNIPDLRVGITYYLELFKENPSLFQTYRVYRDACINEVQIKKLINNYTDKIVLANTELLVE